MTPDNEQWPSVPKISTSSPNSLERMFPVTKNYPFLDNVPLYNVTIVTFVLVSVMAGCLTAASMALLDCTL